MLPAAVHMDPKIFPDPEEFNPERFLDGKGQFRRNDHVVAFGMGKRRCVGEKLGRAEAFLVFAHLMQRFRFSKVEELDFRPVIRLVLRPRPFEVIVEERK